MSETDAEVPQIGVEFSVIPSTLTERFLSHFPNFTNGLVKGEPGDFVLTQEYADVAQSIYNLPLRADDTWIVTYPKCGTTWAQEMVWLIVNNCDFEGAKKPLGLRSPFLEFPYLRTKSNGAVEGGTDFFEKFGGLETVNELASPRVIKTHLPLYLLNPELLDTCKVVYVARNPKDVLVSYYYHHKLMKIQNFTGDIETFAEYFMSGEVYHGSIISHLLEAFYRNSAAPNMLFIFYEDLVQDLRGGIQQVADFLGKPLTDEQLTRLTEHLRFDNFSKNEAVNAEAGKDLGLMNKDGHFIRKGKSGDWKNHFSTELDETINRWIFTGLAGTNLPFTAGLE